MPLQTQVTRGPLLERESLGSKLVRYIYPGCEPGPGTTLLHYQASSAALLQWSLLDYRKHDIFWAGSGN